MFDYHTKATALAESVPLIERSIKTYSFLPARVIGTK